jgi:hypothetical protein
MDGTWVDGEELLREDAGKDQLVVRRVVAHGRSMVDIRRHYETDTNDHGGDPVYAPGRKGVLISEELAARVGEALRGLAQDAAQGLVKPDRLSTDEWANLLERIRTASPADFSGDDRCEPNRSR